MIEEKELAPSLLTEAGSEVVATSVETWRAEMMDWLRKFSSKHEKWNEDRPLLSRTGLVLAVIPILLFAFFALSSVEIDGFNFVRGTVCYLANCEWNYDSYLGLSALYGILAAGLTALLVVELVPRKAFKGWSLPASSLAIVSGINLLIYISAFPVESRLGPDNPLVPTLWLATISCGLLFFGLGCIKLTTLKGPYISAAIGLSSLNGIAMLLHILFLMSRPGYLLAGH